MVRRLCLVAALVAAVPVVLASPAGADVPSTVLGLPNLAIGPGYSGPAHLLVDRAHSQILVSGRGGLDVAAIDGSSALHVAASPQAVGGLAFSNDKATLWYTDATGGALVATDAAKVATAVPSSHQLPSSKCPSELAVDGSDRVWFLYRPCSGGVNGAGLGVYDPSTDVFDLAPAVDAQVSDIALLDVLENNPATPNTIVVASDNHTTAIDVGTSTVHPDADSPAGAGDLAVTSDGTQALRGFGGLQLVPTANPGSTTDAVSFDADPLNDQDHGVRAVALSADDTYAAAAYWPYIVSFGTAAGNRGWIRRCEDAQDVAALAWDGADVWFVRQNSIPMQLGRCAGMTQPQSFLKTPQVPPDLAGTALELPVTLSFRNAPIAGATISVRRTGPAGSTDLADLTTDANGSATLNDTLPRGTSTYHLDFAGDGVHPAYSTTMDVLGTTLRTDFVNPLVEQSARIDQPITLHNQLLETNSNNPLASRTVQVTRIDPSGRHRLHDVVTDSSGGLTVTDTPRFGPIARYVISYAGDASHLATTATYTVNVARLAPPLGISLQYKAIYYNQTAVVRAHLGKTYTGRTVSLWMQPTQAASRRLVTARVGPTGYLTARAKVSRNTKFTAVFKGDYRYAPKQVSVTEYAAVRTKLDLGGQYKISGKFHLFHVNTQVELIGTVLPAHAGYCLRFAADHRVGTKWVSDGYSQCAPTNFHGRGILYFLPRNPVLNVVYRFQSFYLGDPIHYGSDSVIRYGKFTG